MIANIDVDDLLSRMTLEEKCAQLGGVWFSDLFTAGQFDEAKMQQLLGDGIGQVTRISGTGFAPADAAAAVDRIQRFLAEHTRLGIPALPHEEALAGLMGPGCIRKCREDRCPPAPPSGSALDRAAPGMRPTHL